MSKKKEMEISKPQALAVQVPENWMEDMKKEAKDAASKEVLFGSRISFKGGDIAIAGEPVQGNKLPVIIVDFACEKAYYPGKFDPKNTKPPVCYAMGRDEKTLKPHPQAPQPQAATCAECQWNRFGTSEMGARARRARTVGGSSAWRGTSAWTGCSVRRSFLRSSRPTSLKGWALYLKGLGEIGRPPFAVMTQLGIKKVETYFHVTFDLLGNVPNDLAYMVSQRRAGIEEMLFAPYPTMAEEEKKAPAKALKGKGKGRE